MCNESLIEVDKIPPGETETTGAVIVSKPFCLYIDNCDVCMDELISANPSMISLVIGYYSTEATRVDMNKFQIQRLKLSKLHRIILEPTLARQCLSTLSELLMQLPKLRVLNINLSESEEKVYEIVNRIINETQVTHLALYAKFESKGAENRRLIINNNSTVILLSIINVSTLLPYDGVSERSNCTIERPIVVEIFKSIELKLDNVGYCQLFCMVDIPQIRCQCLDCVQIKGNGISIGILRMGECMKHNFTLKVDDTVTVQLLSVSGTKLPRVGDLVRAVEVGRNNIRNYYIGDEFANNKSKPFPTK